MGEITVVPKRVHVYQRPRSAFWQMRYRLGSGEWERRSTKTADLEEAKQIALAEYNAEQIKAQNGIPSSKKTLRFFAEKYVENLKRSIELGKQTGTFEGYIRIAEKWIIPHLGHVKIGSLDHTDIKRFEDLRENENGGPISKSALNSQNVVLRGILRLAAEQRYIKVSDFPVLTTKGKGRSRQKRPPFSEQELQTIWRNFPDWVDSAIGDDAKYRRQLLAHYAHFLACTGIRPGEEALGIKWRHITRQKPSVNYDAMMGDPAKRLTMSLMDQYLVDDDILKIVVTNGKIHNRKDQAQQRIVIARDDIKPTLSKIKALTHRANPDDYVFPTMMGNRPFTGFSPMFTKFLNEIGLLYTPDGRRRVLYSLRHTYTNMAIKKDKLPLIVIAQNMGTSIEMLEDYYTEIMVEHYADALSQ